MGCLNNVIELNKSNAKDYIDLFLRKKGNNSDNTRLTYETAILQFFKALYNIDSLEFVTDEMISSLTSVKCQNYFQEMVDSEKYAMSSIKNKLIAVRSLFQNIVDDRVTDVRGNLLLDYNPLKTYDIKSEGQSYGLLTHDEMIKILQLVKEDGDTQLYLYYALMYKCALRKEECRNIKLQDFYIKDDIARVKVLCKGNKLEDCECGNELYELAKSIAKEDGTLFTFAKNYAFNKLIQKTTYHKNGNVKTRFDKCYCARIGLTEEECNDRIIVLHSVKKASVKTCVNMGATLDECARHGHHVNTNYISTYCNDNELSKTSRYINLEQPVNNDIELLDKLQGLDKQTLIDLIMGLNDKDKMDIMSKLNQKEMM